MGCKDPGTATACGYGLALFVILHFGRPEVLQSLISRLKDTQPSPVDTCARVLCGLDVNDNWHFIGELGMIAAGLAGLPPDRITGKIAAHLSSRCTSRGFQGHMIGPTQS